MTRARWRLAAAATTLGATILACSAIVGIEDPFPRPPLDGGTDATVGDTGATNDAADVATCRPAPDEAQGIFVSKTSGQDGVACGALHAPCASIQQGIQRAQAQSKSMVYVAASQAPYFGPIALAAGITVQGGWSEGPSWTSICSQQSTAAVTVAGSANAPATVLAVDLGGTATLDTLTVLSKAASLVDAGETVYAIRALGSSTTLVLQDVIVRAVGGGDGIAGAAGNQGAPAADAGCDAGSGGTGDGGSTGTAPEAGTFGDGGYMWSMGTGGGTGAAGDPGVVGGTGACSAVDACYCGPGSNMKCTQCGQTGLSGCGGPGGGGGGPGGGGGSSVAVFISEATVRGSGGILQAGSGGTGGAGGTGGPGGAGTEGAPGAAARCDTTCTCSPSFCCIPGNPVPMDGGTEGGAGGAGGTGGSGAGGAGGWSCAYVVVGDAGVTWKGTALLAGDAGTGGPPNGPSGIAQEKCP